MQETKGKHVKQQFACALNSHNESYICCHISFYKTTSRNLFIRVLCQL